MRLQRFVEEESGTGDIYAIRIAANRFFSDTARLKKSCRRGRLEATRAERMNGGHAVDGGSR